MRQSGELPGLTITDRGEGYHSSVPVVSYTSCGGLIEVSWSQAFEHVALSWWHSVGRLRRCGLTEGIMLLGEALRRQKPHAVPSLLQPFLPPSLPAAVLPHHEG